jgi:pimeloyl-ACP methyl ester carboxylesterase
MLWGQVTSTRHPNTYALITQHVHTLADQEHIAYRSAQLQPHRLQQPCVIFLHGLYSTMKGTKAVALEQHAANGGYNCLLFDQRGHGR